MDPFLAAFCLTMHSYTLLKTKIGPVHFCTDFCFASHLAVFVIEREGLARLDFIQNMEYKFVELLSVRIYQMIIQDLLTLFRTWSTRLWSFSL